MRLAIVLAPAARTSRSRLAEGARRLMDVLSKPEVGFETVWVDVGSRPIDRVREAVTRATDGELLVAYSGPALVDEEYELKLGPAGRGPSLADVAECLDGSEAARLLLLDLVHPEDPEDPVASVSVVGVAREQVDPKASGIAALVAARTSEDGSPLLDLLLHSLSTIAVDPRTGSATASQIYERMRQQERFVELPAAGYFRGQRELLLRAPPSVVIGDPASIPPPPGSERERPWRSGDELLEAGQAQAALGEYKKALLTTGPKSEERAELYFRMGRAKAALGSDSEAVHNFDKALAIQPLHADAFEHAQRCLLDQTDFTRLEGLHKRRLEALSDDSDKADAYRALAKLWLERAQEPKRALPVLQSWLARGDDEEALELLAGAEHALGRHSAAVSTQRRLARASTDPTRRAEVLVQAAQAAREHLPGAGEAVELAREALQADPTALAALEIAAAVLGQGRRWRDLAALYEGVLERVQDDDLGWDLAKKLGVLARDQLDDAEQAKRAFERAAGHNPRDSEVHSWLAELYEHERDHLRASEQRRAAQRIVPDDPELVRRALWSFEKSGDDDAAWNAACVLDYLEEADINESLLADTFRPEGLLSAQGNLDDAAFRLLWPERDADLGALFDLVGSAAIEWRAKDLAEHLPKLSPQQRVLPTQTTTLARSLIWTARLLDVPSPALYVLPQLDSRMAVLPTTEPTALADRALGSGLSLPELSFLWGRTLSALRPELSLVRFFSSPADLAHVVLAALALGGRGAAADSLDGTSQQVRRVIDDALDDEQREALRELTPRLSTRRMRVRLEAWLTGAQRASARAGMVLAGDVGLAAALSVRYPREDSDPTAERNDLLGFALSRQYGQIRRRLGVSR